MNILVVNLYFPPDTSATAGVFLDLTRALIDRGHQPIVVCGRPSYDASSETGDISVTGLAVERVWSASFDRRNMSGRLLNYISFLISSQLKVGGRDHRVDAVIVGTDPPLVVRAALRLARGAPVIYSLQDLHPEAALVAGWVRPGLGSRVWEKLHVAALRRVDAIVAIGRDMEERIQAKGIPGSRIEVVPNGAPPPVGPPDPVTVDEIRRGRSFLAVHAGNLGAIGAWDTLMAARDGLDGSTDLIFIGAGVAAEEMRKRGAEILPPKPPDQVPSIMAAGDLQVVTMAEGMEGVAVPSKLYTILAHGRPVLAVVPESSEVAEVVRSFGCGYVVDPTDAGSVTTAIKHAASHPEHLAEMARAAKKAGAHFERSKCMERIVDVVEDVVRQQDL